MIDGFSGRVSGELYMGFIAVASAIERTPFDKELLALFLIVASLWAQRWREWWLFLVCTDCAVDAVSPKTSAGT